MNNTDFFKGNASSLYSKRVACPKCNSMDTEASVLSKAFLIFGIFLIVTGVFMAGSIFLAIPGLVVFCVGVFSIVCAIIDKVFFRTVQMNCKECGNTVHFKGKTYEELAKETRNSVDKELDR